MPAYIDRDGFPLWGNPSPQIPGQIPARQIQFMIEDAAINQIPGGRTDEIPLIQKAIPKQARAEGLGANDLLEVGKYGSSLYDAFMQPIEAKLAAKGGTP